MDVEWRFIVLAAVHFLMHAEVERLTRERAHYYYTPALSTVHVPSRWKTGGDVSGNVLTALMLTQCT